MEAPCGFGYDTKFEDWPCEEQDLHEFWILEPPILYFDPPRAIFHFAIPAQLTWDNGLIWNRRPTRSPAHYTIGSIWSLPLIWHRRPNRVESMRSWYGLVATSTGKSGVCSILEALRLGKVFGPLGSIQ